jgi:quercetin dioxygenase-like cupin family protein
MVGIAKKISTLIIIGFLFTHSAAFAKEAEGPIIIPQDAPAYIDFNSIPLHQLTDKISMRFVTTTQFTVSQWNVKAGAKLPVHSHVNELVTRVLKGEVKVHTGDTAYTLHAGDVIIFPPNVTHGFTAITDIELYEQESPIRQDFLSENFIKNVSEFLKKNQ